MIDEKTPNKNYPLPNPANIASQDVGRIAASISMIDSDISECDSVIDELQKTVEKLDDNAIRIPDELVGHFDTELKDVSSQKYMVINSDCTGFSTVEGGGGEGGKKGEVLVKRSNENFDTTWIDPRAVQKRAPVVNETNTDAQLPNNGFVILADAIEIDNSNQLPRHGLTHRQINMNDTIDENYSYILCDELEETDTSDSDIASKTNYGRVKIGDGINVEDGIISTQEYKQATSEEFGTIKLSDDFTIGSEGELVLAGKREADYIIYQSAKVEVIHGSNIVISPECALYRAYITADMDFQFDFSKFIQEKDLAFDVEIFADSTYVVSFENVVWNMPCAGVSNGKTVIHFEKKLGSPYIEGNLKEATIIKE